MGSAGAVVVVGDLMVDVVAVPDGPLAPGSDTASVVRSGGGGSAANVACWLAAAGGRVELVAAVGDDPLGAGALDELARSGVRWAGAVLPRPTGACVVLVDQLGERTMLPDRGANDALPAAVVEAALAQEPAWLHLSGYALLGEGSRDAALAGLAAARTAGVPVSVDASSAAPLRALGPERFLSWIDGCDLLFANDDELAALGGETAALDAAEELVTKHGPAGASWTDGSSRMAVPAVSVEVVDTVGAGDAFDAGYLGAAVRGVGPEPALRAAADLAARCVSTWGGRPASSASA